MKRRLIAGGVLLGLLTLAGATYAPPLTLAQQAVKAEVIVRATVGTPVTVQESAQSWTVYPVMVLETLAGDAGTLPKYQDKPSVWVLTGLQDGPTLKNGEAMLLLYKARTDSPLVGFTQGQYSVEGGAEKKVVSGLPDGTPGVVKTPPPAITPSAGASAGVTTPSTATTTPSAGTSTPSAGTTTPSSATITPSAATTTPSAGAITTPSAATTITPSAAESAPAVGTPALTPSSAASGAGSTPSSATPSSATPSSAVTPSAAGSVPTPTLGESATVSAPATTPSATVTTTPSSAAVTTPSAAASATPSAVSTTPSAATATTPTPSTATTPSSASTPPVSPSAAVSTPPVPAALGPGQLTLDAFRQAVLAARAKAGK